MSGKIRIGICGYGNLGKGAATGIEANPDMELVAVFSRRKQTGLSGVKAGVPVLHVDDAPSYKDKIDVMLMCGGSSGDVPVQGPVFAKNFSTVDSFDTHAVIPEHIKAMDKSSKEGGNISVVSVGWDPGFFSLMRLYMTSALPLGATYTFWGRGVSQGHSEAVRRIDGVVNAIQYTIPSEEAMQKVRSGENPELTTREKTKRLCYVAASDNADKAKIEREIKEMPYYFDEYDTTVEFVSEEELKKNHSTLPHGGSVIHTGTTGAQNKHSMEFTLKLDSNPEFTASVMLAYARAAYRLSQKGETGVRTIFDIPPALLSRDDMSEVIRNML